jgi:hypothetical protein
MQPESRKDKCEVSLLELKKQMSFIKTLDSFQKHDFNLSLEIYWTTVKHTVKWQP